MQCHLSSTWHLIAAGPSSWYGPAEEIFRQARGPGLISTIPTLTPISIIEYPPLPAAPLNFCLDTRTLERDFNVRCPTGATGLPGLPKSCNTKVLQKLA